MLRKVLVADDDAHVRAAVRQLLEGRGHAVSEASTAAEVFEAIEGDRPDVVLLDVHLGPEDGLAIGLGLRQEKLLARTKIVFMTGTLDGSLQDLSRRMGADVLAKPIDPELLSEAVSA